MSTVRVAIAGVGNCASSLVQGISYYRDARPDDVVPGLMHVVLGGYHVRRPRAGGRLRRGRGQGGHRPRQGDLRRAEQHDPLRRGRRARRDRAAGARPSTGSAATTATWSRSRPPPPVDVAEALRRGPGRRAGRLPPGRLRGGPAPLRRGLPRGQGGLRQRHPGVHRLGPRVGPAVRATPACPIIGDDIKSQVGSTIVHRVLTRLFEDRGLALDHTYQLNVGGNMDFRNMLERDRLESKKISKTQAVTSQIEHAPLPGTTSTSAPPTTCRGWPTASGPTSAWRAGTSATCRSTSSSSSRCGTPPTRPG